MSRIRATCSLAAALLLAGGSFDSPSLYVPAVGLLLLAAGATAWVRLATREASVERLPGAWSVVEGEPYLFAVRVRAGRIPTGVARVIDPLVDRPLPLDAATEGVLEGETRFQRRGRQKLPQVSLEIGDPFGLRVARVRGSEASAVLVLPRVEPLAAPPLDGQLAHGGGGGGGPGQESGLDAVGVDFELDGLRPYRPGTSASRIHWRSVARRNELIEHRLVSGGGLDPLVVLDAHLPEGTDELDRVVRAAASLCVALAPGGGCNLLLPGEARPVCLSPGMRGWPDLHARLALVKRTRNAPVVGRSGSAVFWVSAAADAADAAVRAGVAGGYLVTPGEPRPGDAFAVAGCRGRALGTEGDRMAAGRVRERIGVRAA